MEYSYTREFRQKHKTYAISLARNGVTYEAILVFLGILLFFGVVAIVSFVKNISFLTTLFVNGYLLISFFIGVFVWFVFSLKWDNKPMLTCLVDRVGFAKTKKCQSEQGHKLVLYKQPVTYQSGVRAYASQKDSC